MSSTSTLDVASAVKLLPTSVVHQLLLDLAEKDATLQLQLISLATPYQEEGKQQQPQETMEKQLKSAQHRIQQLERDVEKLSNRDRRERRMLLLEEFVDTISTVRFTEACSGIILSSLEGASIQQYEARMERILAVDEWYELLASSSESTILDIEMESAFRIVKDSCSGPRQYRKLAEDYDGKFSPLVSPMFCRVFSGYIFDVFPSTTGKTRMNCPPAPYVRPYPGQTSPSSPAILLSFPPEITRLIFHLGAEELLPPLGMIRYHDRQISYRIRNSYLRNASLVHPLWRHQAQAELVTFAYCDEKKQLNGLVTFLEESKQSHVLRNISLEVNSDSDSTEVVILTEKEMLSYGYKPERSRAAPLWYAAKRLLDLGVCLDRLELMGLRPGPMTWSLLRQSERLKVFRAIIFWLLTSSGCHSSVVPARTLYLAHSFFSTGEGEPCGLRIPLPHTTRLVLDCTRFYGRPTSTTMFHTMFNDSCSTTELTLYKPFLHISRHCSMDQIWTPLIWTVTSLSHDLRFKIDSLGLQWFTGLSEIRVHHRKGPPSKLPQVEELCSIFPKLTKLVLPKESAWNFSEKEIKATATGAKLDMTRRSSYSEKRRRLSQGDNRNSHRYFHNGANSEDEDDDDSNDSNGNDGGDDDHENDEDDNEDQGEGSSAYTYSSSEAYGSVNGSIEDDVPVEFSDYESETETDQDLESLMDTFVAFEGAEFRRNFPDDESDLESLMEAFAAFEGVVRRNSADEEQGEPTGALAEGEV